MLIKAFEFILNVFERWVLFHFWFKRRLICGIKTFSAWNKNELSILSPTDYNKVHRLSIFIALESCWASKHEIWKTLKLGLLCSQHSLHCCHVRESSSDSSGTSGSLFTHIKVHEGPGWYWGFICFVEEDNNDCVSMRKSLFDTPVPTAFYINSCWYL